MRMFSPEKNRTVVVVLAMTAFGVPMWAVFVVFVAVRLQSYSGVVLFQVAVVISICFSLSVGSV